MNSIPKRLGNKFNIVISRERTLSAEAKTTMKRKLPQAALVAPISLADAS